MQATDKYMQMAIDEALLGINEGHGGPFGTVIIKDGEVIGRGHNKVLKNNDPTCHGEIVASSSGVYSACSSAVSVSVCSVSAVFPTVVSDNVACTSAVVVSAVVLVSKSQEHSKMHKAEEIAIIFFILESSFSSSYKSYIGEK